MKKRIEHTFCDHCRNEINEGFAAYVYANHDYHENCIRDAIRNDIGFSGTIYIASAFNPYSPSPMTMLEDETSSFDISAQLFTITRSLDEIKTYKDLIGQIFRNATRLPKNIDADHLGAAIAETAEDPLPVVIDISAKKYIKNGSAPTIVMDASVSAWIYSIPGSEDVYVGSIFGKEYSSFNSKPMHITCDNDETIGDLVEKIISSIIEAFVCDVATVYIVKNEDVDNLIDDGNGTCSQVDTTRPIHPGRADLTDRTGELFNL